MPTKKYEFDDVLYGVTGYDEIINGNFGRIETHLHSRSLGRLGEAISPYMLVYVSRDDGYWYRTLSYDSNLPALGMTLEYGNEADTVRIQHKGLVENELWSLEPGKLCYVGNTYSGSMTQVKPVLFDSKAQVVGIALSATVIWLNINLRLDVF